MNVKIIVLCLLVVVAAVVIFRKPSLEKYRESRVINGGTVTIDVCVQKGADTKKISRSLDDAWQRIREPGPRTSAEAIDQTVKILRKRGLHQFLIDVHGDTYAAGLNCNRQHWKIAVKAPGSKAAIVDVVEIADSAVSVFADKSAAISVIAPAVNDSSLLARTIAAQGVAQGMAMIDGRGKAYAAILVSKDSHGRLTVVKSANYKNFRIKRR